MDPSWRFPRLGHELAVMGAGFGVACAAVGAALVIAWDVFRHRHRTGG